MTNAPRIQYAKTSDGVSIAYFTLGEGGVPLLDMNDPIASHLQLLYKHYSTTWYDRLVPRRMVVSFDHRGTGLSDRLVGNYSLDAFLKDIEAVVDRVGLDRFAVWSWPWAGAVAIAYAVRHPERVSRLVLWHSPARTAALDLPQVDALRTLSRVDWDSWIETMSRIYLGWSASGAGESHAAVWREAVSEEDFAQRFSTIRQFDVEDLLPEVSVPTLVFHRRRLPWFPLDVARQMASRIPNAQLVPLEGDSPTPWVGDSATVFRVLEEFLAEGEREPLPELPSGTAIILFADIVDSTALTERLGDATFRDKAREVDAALRTMIRDNAGTCIDAKTLGDGVLAVFTSARQAIEAALACGKAGDAAGLPLHLGLHAGDVIREENNVYGGAVNIASRISGLSAPGEVLVSDTVRSLARTSAGVTFEDRGERALKGVGEPLRVWAVRERE